MNQHPRPKFTSLGHATVRCDLPGGEVVLIDPWVQGNPACPEEHKELGRLDAMLITHAHFDHIGGSRRVHEATAAPIRLHAGITAPRKIVDVAPVYPSIAQAARKQGVVILETVIDARGNVQSVHVLRSVPLLDDAAVAAVRQWRFTPALLNGEPVPVVMTVTVNFKLQDE